MDMSNIKNNIELKRIRIIHYMLMLVTVVMTIIVTVKVAIMGFFPLGYLIAVEVMIVLFLLLTFFSYKKKPWAIMMAIMLLLINIGLVFGLIAINKVDHTVAKVTQTTPVETTEMAVIVLKSDTASQLKDINLSKLGYIAMDEEAIEAVEMLDEEVSLDYVLYESVLQMSEDLLDQKVRALLVNSAFIDVIASLDGHEDFADQIKVLYTVQVHAIDQKIEMNNEYPLQSGEDTMVVYLSGVDAWGGIQVKSRSDVNIIAVINMKTGKIQLINTPRDYYVNLPWYGQMDKLTHAGLYGVDCSKETLESLYGTKIDYYVRMNFSGFEAIINALNGVDVYSAYDFEVEPIKHYTVGYNHVNGLEALAFARERHAFAAGDVQRGINQMEVIKAVINKMTSFTMVTNYSTVFDAVSECIQTDMSSEVLYDLVRYQLSHNVKWEVESYTVTGDGSHEVTYSMPEMTCYVMYPHQAEVEEAKRLIQTNLEAE